MRYVIYCGRFDGTLRYCVYDEVNHTYFDPKGNSWGTLVKWWSPNLTKVLEALSTNLNNVKPYIPAEMELRSV